MNHLDPSDIDVLLLGDRSEVVEDLLPCLEPRELGLDFVSSHWDEMEEQLQFQSGEVTLIFLSLAILCDGGLDLLMEADARLRGDSRVRPVLIVEPWVAQEMESVRLMTGFRYAISAGYLQKDLLNLLPEILPELKKNPSTPRVTTGTQATAVVREIVSVESGDLSKTWLSRVMYSAYVRGFTGTLKLKTMSRERRFLVQNGEFGQPGGGVSKHLMAAFAWTEGTYELIPGKASSNFVSYGNTLRLIYDGCIRFISLNQAAARLAECDSKYPIRTRFVSDRARSLGNGVDTLWRFCQLCDGSMVWNKVLSSSWRDIKEMLKVACYAIDTDLVVLTDAPDVKGIAQVQYTTRSTRGILQTLKARPQRHRSKEGKVLSPEQILNILLDRLDEFSNISSYQLFELEEGCGADAVRNRFYSLVKKHHPDVYGNVSPEVQSNAELIFILVKDAYADLLSLEGGLKDGRAPSPSAKHSSTVRRQMQERPSRYRSEEEPAQRSPRTSRGNTRRSRPPASEPPISRRAPRTNPAPAPQTDRGEAPPAPRSRRAVQAPGGPVSRRVAQNAAPPGPVSRKVSSGATENRPSIRPRRAFTPQQNGTTRPPAPPPSTRKARSARPVKSRRPLPNESSSLDHSMPPSMDNSSPPSSIDHSLPPIRQSTSGIKSPGDATRKPFSRTTDRKALSAKISPEAHFRNGRKFLSANRYRRAKEAFRLAIKGDEHNLLYRSYFAWARYLSEPDEVKKCLGILKECIEQDDPPVESLVFMGHILKRQNRHDKAIKFFRKALKIDENNVDALREVRLADMREARERRQNRKAESFFGKLFQRKKEE